VSDEAGGGANAGGVSLVESNRNAMSSPLGATLYEYSYGGSLRKTRC
jgi:hypothetical protein